MLQHPKALVLSHPVLKMAPVPMGLMWLTNQALGFSFWLLFGRIQPVPVTVRQKGEGKECSSPVLILEPQSLRLEKSTRTTESKH